MSDKPSIAASTLGGKIFIYRFDKSEDEGNSLNWLNFNKRISHLSTGIIEGDSKRECLIVGSANTVSVYGSPLIMQDVFENKDLFYLDISDGVTCVYSGVFGSKNENLFFIGGNCSLQGFDSKGEEKYWNMTSDNVLSICLCDIDEDGEMELVVGCEDSKIIIFKGEEMIHDIDLNSAVIILESFVSLFFAFGLRNGTFGVYERKKLLWKEKRHEGIIGMCPIIKNEEFEGLIVGFRVGKIELRNSFTGAIITSIEAKGQISSLMRSNFADIMENQIIAILRDGAVYGYDISWDKQEEKAVTKADLSLKLSKLAQERNRLMALIDNISAQEQEGEGKALVPEDTNLELGLKFDFKQGCPLLIVKCKTAAVIRGVVITGEKVIENGKFVYFEKNCSNQLLAPLYISKHSEDVLRIQAFIGNTSESKEFKLVEKTLAIQKFLIFMPLDTSKHPVQDPVSSVKFKVKERSPRVKVLSNS